MYVYKCEYIYAHVHGYICEYIYTHIFINTFGICIHACVTEYAYATYVHVGFVYYILKYDVYMCIHTKFSINRFVYFNAYNYSCVGILENDVYEYIYVCFYMFIFEFSPYLSLILSLPLARLFLCVRIRALFLSRSVFLSFLAKRKHL